jgi:hypothetical protein
MIPHAARVVALAPVVLALIGCGSENAGPAGADGATGSSTGASSGGGSGGPATRGAAGQSPGDGGLNDQSVGYDGIASTGATAGGDATAAGDVTASSDASSDANRSAGWLSVVGNKIMTSNGKPFHGRGANLHDTRSCDACTSQPADIAGLNKWSDELIDRWHANFIRFDLEAYADSGGYRTQWQSLGVDAQYLADIKTTVNHMTSKPGVYVMVTLFQDPSQVQSGAHDEWPTDATLPLYAKLAETFYDDPGVLFGLMNEPHDPATENANLAAIFTKAIQSIRDVEKKHSTPMHIIVAQAAQGYARDLSYWVANPLIGSNIAYETHPYNHPVDFDMLFVQPAKSIPVIIGEFGPATIGSTVYMTEADTKVLMQVAETNEIPYVGWNFHQRCPPNMLQDTAQDGCGMAGAGTTYTWPVTPWGQILKDRLAQPW